MKSKRTIVITSREPYNTEGNSHMHYLDTLLNEGHDVIFVNPPLKWLRFDLTKKKSKNLTLLNYRNFFPIRFFHDFFHKLNDLITAAAIKKLIKNKEFILWQFDPYYLLHLGRLKPHKIIYFPLDYYGSDKRDQLYAQRADLIIAVNQLVVEKSYTAFQNKLIILQHGYSEKQKLSEDDKLKSASIKEKYGDYFIFCGLLNDWLDYELLIEIAQEIHPKKLLLLGRKISNNEQVAELLRLGNVEFIGHVDYSSLKYYISPAISCLVVYGFANEGARNPIKITDYLSQNKTIINNCRAKDLNILEGKCLYTAHSREDFMKYVKLANDGELFLDQSFVENWKQDHAYENLLQRIWKELDQIAEAKN